jgi:membrane-associated protein
MFDLLYAIAPYAPVVILLAAFLDIFFISGYILYGGATLAVVGMMYMTGMITIPEIIATALTGTLLGNQVNYWIGRSFHNVSFITKKLSTPHAQKAEHFLRSHGLLLYMLLGNFITFFRPIHGLILGTFNISWWRFFSYDLIISFVWVIFWLMLILYGEKMYLYLFV